MNSDEYVLAVFREEDCKLERTAARLGRSRDYVQDRIRRIAPDAIRRKGRPSDLRRGRRIDGTKVERNQAVFDDYRHTENLAATARRFNLTRERVRQIINNLDPGFIKRIRQRRFTDNRITTNCANCGKEMVVLATHNKPNVTCSTACRGKLQQSPKLQRCYELRQAGLNWEEIGNMVYPGVKFPTQVARNQAALYAKRSGRPMPPLGIPRCYQGQRISASALAPVSD